MTIAGACHVVFPIEPQLDADTGQGSLPRVFSSPEPAADLYGGYPKSHPVTLAANDPATTIYYTTDGSAPDLASTSAITPITEISIAATTTLRYLGVNAAGQAQPKTDVFAVMSGAQSLAGYLVTRVSLDGMSPVVNAMPGQVFTASANVQIWVQSGGAGFQAQLVYGVGNVDQGCLFDAPGKLYPGDTMSNQVFSVTAPVTPGVHEVRVGHIERANCADAMAYNGTGTLANRPTIARIGAIVVR